MADMRELASGLEYPEGPIVLEDESILLVESKRGTLTRVSPEGKVEVVAELGGSPTGASLGPSGAAYVCNSSGFEWHEIDGLTISGHQPADYVGGSIQRVDLDTGAVETLYTECDGNRLRGPNDIVFDADGGFWFTDAGKTRPSDRDHGGLYYGRPDGSFLKQVLYPLEPPNGIGLSPDDRRLYVTETHAGRLWSWDIVGPGELKPGPPLEGGGDLVIGLPRFQLFDSLAMEANGNICVATLVTGAITVISPEGREIEQVRMPDPLVSNLCFGGPAMQTAYITLSGTGRLVEMDWERPGARLHYAR